MTAILHDNGTEHKDMNQNKRTARMHENGTEHKDILK